MILLKTLNSDMFFSQNLWKVWIGYAIMLTLEGPHMSYCGCPVTLDERTVARMCYDSEASGTRVYIDTSGAKATENIPANVCQCTVSFYNSKFLHINSTSLSPQCGSVLEFNRTGEKSILTGQDCAAYKATSALQWPSDEMVISLHKQTPPYKTEFCVSLDLVYCNLATEYQCRGGACIERDRFCDSFPDCDQSDDEQGCPRACSEGQVSCADNSGCYKQSEKCDNITSCSDGSDEHGCGYSHASTAKTSMTTKKPVTEPMIKVRCIDSMHFTTTTSTTTTTTTTMPSTTTTTTTTTTKPTTTATTTTTQTTSTLAPSTFQSSTSSLSTSGETSTNQSISAVWTTNQFSIDTTTSDSNAGNTGNYWTDKPLQSKEGTSNIFTHPYVIMAIVIGAIFLSAVTGFIIYFILQKRRKPKSHNQDLWIPNAGEEMEPFNG